MTTLTPTQAELEAAHHLIMYFAKRGDITGTFKAEELAEIIAAHRAAPPADPTVAHAAELEMIVREIAEINVREGLSDKYLRTLQAEAHTLITILDTERKAQVTP